MQLHYTAPVFFFLLEILNVEFLIGVHLYEILK